MDQGIGQFIPLILIFVIFYFFLIRPQQKRVKDHKAMVELLKRGDEIITSGGILGTVDRIMEDDRAEVIIGDNVKVQNDVSIYTGVICENDVFLGPSMVLTNILNPRSAVIRKDSYVNTIVRKGASIGANATVICGNEIGEFALIGAGAVITKNVKPYALIVGNPGKQIGWVSQYGHRLNFKNGKAKCQESSENYELSNNIVKRIS